MRIQTTAMSTETDNKQTLLNCEVVTATELEHKQQEPENVAESNIKLEISLEDSELLEDGNLLTINDPVTSKLEEAEEMQTNDDDCDNTHVSLQLENTVFKTETESHALDYREPGRETVAHHDLQDYKTAMEEQHVPTSRLQYSAFGDSLSSIQCPFCVLLCPTNAKLVAHVKARHKLYFCAICRIGFPDEYPLIEHKEKLHPEVQHNYSDYLIVSQPDDDSRRPLGNQRKRKKDVVRMFKCDQCAKEYNSEHALHCHKDAAHPCTEVACGECALKFTSFAKLYLHKTKIHLSFKCSQDGKTSSAQRSNKYRLTMHTELNCEVVTATELELKQQEPENVAESNIKLEITLEDSELQDDGNLSTGNDPVSSKLQEAEEMQTNDDGCDNTHVSLLLENTILKTETESHALDYEFVISGVTDAQEPENVAESNIKLEISLEDSELQEDGNLLTGNDPVTSKLKEAEEMQTNDDGCDNTHLPLQLENTVFKTETESHALDYREPVRETVANHDIQDYKTAMEEKHVPTSRLQYSAFGDSLSSIQCPFCVLLCPTNAKLVAHVKARHKLYFCAICRIGFPDEYPLIEHKEKLHPEVQRNYSDYLIVSQPDDDSRRPLGNQRKRKKDVVRMFKCDQCAKEYNSEHALHCHKDTAHPCTEVACGECALKFTSFAKLYLHKTKIHLSFKCSQDGKTSSAQRSNKYRFTMHTKETEMSFCKHKVDTFCFMCGDYLHRRIKNHIMTDKQKEAYKMAFGITVEGLELPWVPSRICSSCSTYLYKQRVGEQRAFKLPAPMKWSQPRDHQIDCFFCKADVRPGKPMKKKSAPSD